MEAKLDSLFERYRSHGDVGALGEVFDRTADELFRLGVHLSRDPVAAEDLLQQTFLTAIEKRDQYDSARPLVPWLTGILSNMARRRWRADARRPDPSRLTWGEPVPQPGGLDDVGPAIRSAVERLEPPYREVVLLSLRFGLKPADIALLTNREPATVRTQLHRGMEKLRARLPVSLSAGLTPALAGTSAIRDSVLATAGAAAATHATPTLALGGLVVTKKGLGVACLLLLWVVCGGAVLYLAERDGHSLDDRAGPPLRPGASVKAAAPTSRESPASAGNASQPRARVTPRLRREPERRFSAASAARPEPEAPETPEPAASAMPDPSAGEPSTPGRARVTSTADAPSYASERSCKMCHFKQSRSWRRTGHGQATKLLEPGERADVKRRSRLDPEKDYTRVESCLKCHTTGYDRPGGYPAFRESWSEQEQKLAKNNQGVGCESCHGPGSLYAEHMRRHESYRRADLVELGAVLPVRGEQCAGCHKPQCPTMPRDYTFDFETARERATFHDPMPLRLEHGEMPR